MEVACLAEFALALGSGALRGAAHIGALMMLEKSGLKPAFIIGSSIGAIVGGFYAAGFGLERLAMLFKEARDDYLFDFTVPLLALNKGKKLEEYLRNALLSHPEKKLRELATKPVNFRNFNPPFAAVATDIVKGESVLLEEGLFIPALLASSATPVVFPPRYLYGRLLADGGILDPLPSRYIKNKYSVTMGVSLEFGHTKKQPKFLPGIVLNMIMSMGSRIIKKNEEEVDVLVKPDMKGLDFWKTGHAEEAIKRGEKAMAEALPLLRALLERTDCNLTEKAGYVAEAWQ